MLAVISGCKIQTETTATPVGSHVNRNILLLLDCASLLLEGRVRGESRTASKNGVNAGVTQPTSARYRHTAVVNIPKDMRAVSYESLSSFAPFPSFFTGSCFEPNISIPTNNKKKHSISAVISDTPSFNERLRRLATRKVETAGLNAWPTKDRRARNFARNGGRSWLTGVPGSSGDNRDSFMFPLGWKYRKRLGLELAASGTQSAQEARLSFLFG
ncbi:hypothetical protein BC567DRAFT_231380 [Phyllosticta citribraziliensis]